MALDPLQEMLTPYVDAIQKSAAAGDRNAQQVIVLYQMYVRCPEAGARTFCEEYFKAWRNDPG